MDFSPPPKPKQPKNASIKIQMKKREAMESILEEEENAATTLGPTLNTHSATA